MSKADTLANNIETIAGAPTERKEPSMNSQPGAPPAQQQTQFFEEKPVEDTKAVPTGDSDKEISKVSDKLIEASGKTGAFLASGGIELIFSFVERLMYIKRFTSDEKARILVLGETPESEQTESDRSLNRKFLAVTKKHEKIRDKIELNKEEKEALELAFAEYTRVTGKTMNAQLIIWSTIAKIFVGRSIDIFL